MNQGEQIGSVLQQLWNWGTDNHPPKFLTHNVMQIAARCAFSDGEIYVYPRKAYLRAKLILNGSMPNLTQTPLGGKQGMVLVEINGDNNGEPCAMVLIGDDEPHPSKAVPFDIMYGEGGSTPELLEKMLSPHDFLIAYEGRNIGKDDR